MGKASSKLKYLRDFNLENKVSKYIESDKKIMSPRHPSTAKMLEETERNAPKVDELSINKNVAEMAKAITLHPDKLPEIKAKNLPQDRMQHDPLEYGTPEPVKVAAGRLSLRMFDSLWDEYKTNKTQQNLNELSKKYNLDAEKLSTLIEYYKPFKAHLQRNEAITEQPNAFETPLANVFSNIKVIAANANKALSDAQKESTKKLN